MKKPMRLLTMALFAVMGFVGGTYYGFKEANNHFYMINQIGQGVAGKLAIDAMKAEDQEDKESFLYSYELTIDYAIIYYDEYQKKRNEWLTNLFLPDNQQVVESWLEELSDHRKVRPVVFSTQYVDDEEGADGNLEIIKRVLKEHGIAEPKVKI